MKYIDNKYLFFGGCCSFAISILHIAIIIGGGDWYRFFGAGEKLALLAENGSLFPIIVTLVIVLIFAFFGLYAFSGAGLVRELPMTKFVLVFISCVYLTRGVGSIPIILFVEHPYFTEISTRIVFVFASSILSLVIGVVYGVGTLSFWFNCKIT